MAYSNKHDYIYKTKYNPTKCEDLLYDLTGRHTDLTGCSNQFESQLTFYIVFNGTKISHELQKLQVYIQHLHSD